MKKRNLFSMRRVFASMLCAALLLACCGCARGGDSSQGGTSFQPDAAGSGQAEQGGTPSGGTQSWDDTGYRPNEDGDGEGEDVTPPDVTQPGGTAAPGTDTPSAGGESGGTQPDTQPDPQPSAVKVTGDYLPAGERHYPIYYVKNSDKQIAISFDSGFEAGFTQELLDILAEYDVKATFFVTGLFCESFPERVKAMAAAGHDVMSHSYSHPSFLKLTTDEMLEELNKTNDLIEELTGVRPTLIRLPYGDWRSTDGVKNDVVDTVRSVGMEPIQWSIDSLDWKEDLTADEVYHRIVDNLHSGAIILCHNAGMTEPEILANVLAYAQEQGYAFVTIQELLLHEDYTIDGNGMMKPA